MSKTHPISPRKSPRQARSIVTVEVILDATIQVLLTQGLALLTTARVAARAGVSVGSVYQYFPNKHALLIAVLTRHVEAIIARVETVCREQRGEPLESMGRALVDAYIGVKMAQPDISRAMCALPANPEHDAVVAAMTARGILAVCDLLASCPSARFHDLSLVAATLCGALIGPVDMLLKGSIPIERAAELTAQLEGLCVYYLLSVAQPVTR
jgi:AcrR family transcriptional regulator